MNSEPPPEEAEPYRYVPVGPASRMSGDGGQEAVGCLDILTVTAGMGCAMALRGVIIFGALGLLILVIWLTGVGNSPRHRHSPTPTAAPTLVLGDAGHWRPLRFGDLLDLQEELLG
jgi:hypothetical protein